ncbi:MAG: pyridoxal phosphate-dependent aminotransferase [Promethearchaeota archaeon]
MELSKITESFTESVIREMTRIAYQHPESVDLAQGFPDFPAPESIKNAAINAIKNNINQYSITWGALSLRKAIADKVSHYNKIKFVDPNKNITITCGATEAMISAMKAIINAGDEVIIFEPFYENYGPDCLLSGAKPRFYKLNPPDWDIETNELENLFNKKTKAIILNTPNNPTGKVFNQKELEFIADLCIKNDCIAITDEIYEHIIYNDQKHISIASFPEMENNSITINSISKTYALTGWRVGWAIACERITNEIKKVHDFLTVGAPAPLQEAGAFALSLGDEYYQKLKDYYQKARDILYNALKNTDLKPIKPKGAYYMMTNCKEYMRNRNLKNSMDLAIHLVKDIGLVAVPGSSFYANPKDGQFQTRFCFCKKVETLQAAIKKLEKINY